MQPLHGATVFDVDIL